MRTSRWKAGIAGIASGLVLLSVPALALAWFGPKAWQGLRTDTAAAVVEEDLFALPDDAVEPELEVATLLKEWTSTQVLNPNLNRHQKEERQTYSALTRGLRRQFRGLGP